jgi:hypothetical protein
LSNSTGMGSNGNVASNHQTASFEGGPQTSNQVSTQSEDENVGQVRLHRRNTLDCTLLPISRTFCTFNFFLLRFVKFLTHDF